MVKEVNVVYPKVIAENTKPYFATNISLFHSIVVEEASIKSGTASDW